MANNNKASGRDHESRPWERIPKWLLPLAILLIVALIYFVSQYAASIILSIYAAVSGLNTAQANAWLTNSVPAQFFYVLIFEAFTVGLLYLMLRHYGRSLKSIGLKSVRWRDGGFALIAFPVYLIAYLVAIAVVQHIYPGLNISQGQNIGFTSVHGNFPLALTFISLVILPPFAEELLFRGFLFEGLKKAMPAVYAGVLTSVLFAVAHLPVGSGGLFWIGALDVFILSLVLVFLKQKTKSLWPGIFLHALKNLVAFISLFLLTNR
jgi:membrane protease YdiL (CAAX protease family)